MCMRDEGIRVYNIIVGMYDINCEWKRVAITRFTCMNVLYMG